MSNKTVIGVIVLLVGILWAAWWGLGGKSAKETPPDQVVSTEPSTVTANHYFDNGSHSIEGTLTLPTPCHTLTNEVVVEQSNPEKVLIKFVTHPGEGVCTQVLADKFFRVTFNAPRDAQISATLDGKPVTLVFSETKEGITK